ncbi:PTS sugar transporter subunit IIB, partial [Pseudomonas sp. SIMBA_041]
FVLVDKASDALALCQGVKGISAVNVGGMRMSEGKRMISPAVAVNEADILTFDQIVSIGVEVEVRQVPTEKKKTITELI